MAKTDQQVRLTIRPAAGWDSETQFVRLRRLLKSMLRSYGWRAVRVEGLPPETTNVEQQPVVVEDPR